MNWYIIVLTKWLFTKNNQEIQLFSLNLIFIERDTALSEEEIRSRLMILKEACDSGDDSKAREALRKTVSTFRSPEEVNNTALNEISENKI